MRDMNFTAIIVASCLLFFLPAAHAERPPVPDDRFVYCTVCHGVQLKGNRGLEAPRLSSMGAWYVKRQLESFSRNWRGAHDADTSGMEMRPMAAILTSQEIDEAAVFVSKARSELPEPTVSGDAARGESLYATCSVCHGTEGEGNEGLGAPGLAGRNDWYLARQISLFRDGVRGSHPADTYGIQMRAAPGVLPDDDAINDVVAYLNTLQPE